ncbi:energy-coupling factor transporter transmembrane component T family protein [Rhodoferax mekongensis]|uniref:energy-coupling factor transporter transmembrane component T family protein n=1 Tax=Rhodoferax mekongensis TaxID=3068341 RepID=UPI0028BF1202|nr:energy-coupling factor transporter transmembrane protein EcfT [Rhodoferax sp. TBRC 17199]MDT7514349.1 energy-coupling factor transporter transmembrane protein EcfT [Rhodoferax sp. TBRC 17199]
MGSLYSEHRTWLHAVPAGWKLGLLVVLSTGIFWIQSPGALGLASALCLCLYLSLGKAMAQGQRLLRALLIAATLVLVFHATLGQPMVGVVSVLRMAGASLLSIALTLTTRSGELQNVLERLLTPLQRFGIRADRFALQLALMLRFVEHFFAVWKRLDDSHRLRTGKGGGLRLLAPLTIQMLQTARRVADTLDVRLGEPPNSKTR